MKSFFINSILIIIYIRIFIYIDNSIVNQVRLVLLLANLNIIKCIWNKIIIINTLQANILSNFL